MTELVAFTPDRFSDESAVAALREAVAARLMPVVRDALALVVQELNALGHDLRLVDEGPDVAAYRDERDERGRLRLAVDLVVSSGYADLVSEEEADVLDELERGNE